MCEYTHVAGSQDPGIHHTTDEQGASTTCSALPLRTCSRGRLRGWPRLLCRGEWENEPKAAVKRRRGSHNYPIRLSKTTQTLQNKASNHRMGCRCQKHRTNNPASGPNQPFDIHKVRDTGCQPQSVTPLQTRQACRCAASTAHITCVQISPQNHTK